MISMKSSEHNIQEHEKGNASHNGAKPNYNAFISGLLGNPSTTKKERERIVELLLKERNKGFVTEDKVLEMIHKYSGIKIEDQESTRPSTFHHNPKAMVSFLYQFSINDTFKWFTHEPDDSFDFDYEMRVKNASKEYNGISKGINASTWNNVRNFILNTNEPAKDYNNAIIQYRWKDMAQWCFEHKHEHPYNALIGNYKFARYIDIFKNTIEFRNVPKFSDRLEDFIYDKALTSPDVKPCFTECFYSIGGQLRAYIDIRQLFSAIKEICKWIIENQSKGNRVEISIEERDDCYVLSIYHIDSYLTIDSQKIKGKSGDFHKVRNMLLNVADWSILADTKNTSLQVVCLDDKTEYLNNKVVTENEVSELSAKVNGVKHLITIYKNK